MKGNVDINLDFCLIFDFSVFFVRIKFLNLNMSFFFYNLILVLVIDVNIERIKSSFDLFVEVIFILIFLKWYCIFF